SMVAGLTITNGHAPWYEYCFPEWPSCWLEGYPGGGIYCQGSDPYRPGPGPTISNCIVTGNRTIGYGTGGGIFGCSGPIVNCTITDNSAREGGGLAVCSGPIINCTISDNNGEGLYRCEGPIEDCVITGNTRGGALYCYGPITNCTVSYNKGYGGLTGCEGPIANCIITHNCSLWPGNGVGVSASRGPITNCTITDNWGIGGVRCYESVVPIINCVIWGNSEPQISGPNTVAYSNVQGGHPGEGNIDVDPVLTGDGHLQMGSPCVDSGDPNGQYAGHTDIDGETRVSSGRVDMGADECIDLDADGLGDWWELRYFGDVNSGDPNGDPECDGYLNLLEYEISSDPTVASRTYYADLNRPHDGGDGLSWQTAKRTIQAAMNTASSNDEVVVGEGVYTGPRNRDLDFFGKRLRVRSKDPSDANIVAATIINCASESYLRRAFFFHSDEGSTSVVEGFRMINGEAYEGGAILCYQSSPTIRNCHIADSNATYGGAICCYYGSPTIQGCKLVDNTAQYGGAIDCNHSDPVICDCNVARNAAVEMGGGVYCSNYSSPTISECAVVANSAGFEGGGICGHIHLRNRAEVLNCVISGNLADSSGGGIARCGGLISRCLVSGNRAPVGSGLYSCRCPITNCTIVGNTSQGLYRCGNFLSNCIIWNNRPVEPGHTRWIYCCVESGGGTGCIDLDPCFAVPGHWDENGTPGNTADDFWVGGDYHLKSQGWRWSGQRNVWTWDEVTSRCVDSGNPGSALGEELLCVPVDPYNEWSDNIRVNMGAYGGTAEASLPPHDWGQLCDINNDGTVDFADVGCWAQYWLDTGGELPGDLDRSGQVDNGDFALLGRDWGMETSWRQ
ncbi:MAG: right-handed parallel beta-helix repeat-containing protein, partial [Planctomycetota bacterium]